MQPGNRRPHTAMQTGAYARPGPWGSKRGAIRAREDSPGPRARPLCEGATNPRTARSSAAPPPTGSPLHRDDLPSGMRDVTDGVMVFLDHRRASIHPAVGRSAAEQEHCYYGSRHKDPPITSAFVSVMHTNTLAAQLRAAAGPCPAEATMTLPIHRDFSEDRRGGGYSHIVLRARNVPLEEAGGGSWWAERTTSVSIDFVPSPVGNWQALEEEDGEVPQDPNGDACGKQQVTREYMLAIRTHASNIREPIDAAGDDSMYVHGMRKVVSHIGWNLCRTPVCNVHLPIVPASITMDDCIRVLQAMRLEVGVPAREEDRIVPEGEKAGWEPLYVLVRRSNLVGGRVMEEVPIDERPMAPSGPEAVAAALAESAQEAMSITRQRDNAPYRIGSRPPLQRQARGGEEGEEDGMEGEYGGAGMAGANTAQGKLSVYTVGSLNTRQMFLVPCAARIINFMKSCMPEALTRDLAGRMVLGAFNALSTERHIDCTHGGRGSGTRTHLLEDIECQETHEYAEHVSSLVQGHIDRRLSAAAEDARAGAEEFHARGVADLHREICKMEASMGARRTLGSARRSGPMRAPAAAAAAQSPSSSNPISPRIRTISTKWDGIPVVVYAVGLDGGSGTPSPPSSSSSPFVHRQEGPAGGALYAFAFCIDGHSVPFALTGMRHLFYPFVPVARPCAEPEFGRGRREAERAVLGLHRYPSSREQMVEDLAREVSPTASSLNYRQRFALQQSFLLQACSIHRQGLGPHKYMLRHLALEWYVRRVKRNLVATGVECSEEGAIEGGRPPVTDADLSFMIASMQKLKREINPHWWFASSIF